MRLSGIICPLCERSGHMATDAVVCTKAGDCKKARLLFTNGNLSSTRSALAAKKAKKIKKERRSSGWVRRHKRKNAVSGESTATQDEVPSRNGGDENTTNNPSFTTSPRTRQLMENNGHDDYDDPDNSQDEKGSPRPPSLGHLQLRRRYKDAQKYGVGHHTPPRRAGPSAPLDSCTAVLFTGGMKVDACRPETQTAPTNQGQSQHQYPTRPAQRKTNTKYAVKFQTRLVPPRKNMNPLSKNTGNRTQKQVLRSTLAPL